jgi:hypothetical protein
MMSNQRLINAGATLANIAFNLAQRDPGEFTARDIAVLKQARKDWDEARCARDATAEPELLAALKKTTSALDVLWDVAKADGIDKHLPGIPGILDRANAAIGSATSSLR